MDFSSKENGPNRRQTANPRESTNIPHPLTPISVDTHYRMGPLFDSVQLPSKWLKSMVYYSIIWYSWGLSTNKHHWGAPSYPLILSSPNRPSTGAVSKASTCKGGVRRGQVPESSSNHIQHSHEIMTHL